MIGKAAFDTCEPPKANALRLDRGRGGRSLKNDISDHNVVAEGADEEVGYSHEHDDIEGDP